MLSAEKKSKFQRRIKEYVSREGIDADLEMSDTEVAEYLLASLEELESIKPESEPKVLDEVESDFNSETFDNEKDTYNDNY